MLISFGCCLHTAKAGCPAAAIALASFWGWIIWLSDCLIVGGYLKPPQLLYMLWPRKERAIKSQRFANCTYPEFYADSLPPTCSSEATLVNWATLLRKACHSRNKIINQRNFLDIHRKHIWIHWIYLDISRASFARPPLPSEPQSTCHCQVGWWDKTSDKVRRKEMKRMRMWGNHGKPAHQQWVEF